MFCEFCGNTATAGTSSCAACSTSTPATSIPASVRASAASRDALQVLRRSLADPVDNVGAAYEALGERRAVDAGIALTVAFDLTIVLAIQIGARKTLGWLAPMITGDSSVISLLKAAILAAVPAVALMAVLLAAQRAFAARLDFRRAVFAGGVTLIPLALMLLIASFLGVANLEVIAVICVAMLSYTTLLLFSACRDVLGIGGSKAAALVPVIFIATAWLSKVVMAALL